MTAVPEWLGPDPPPAGLAALARAAGSALGDTIAFPGLINSHDHLKFNCYAPTGTPPYGDFLDWGRDVQARREMIGRIEAIDVETRAQWGLLKNLLWGVTAVADHQGNPIAGDSVIRVLSCYQDFHSPELERPHKWLTGLGPVVLHLAEGRTAESRTRALRFLGRNLLRRTVAGVHGISLAGGDFAQLDAFIWCPASNLFLFGQTADVASAARQTTVLFGSDSTLSAPGTLWDHLREVRGMMPDEQIFAMLTEAPARFWRLGRRDDFVIARRRRAAPWDAFFALTPDDILVVVRAGRPILLDATMTRDIPLSADFRPLTLGEVIKYVRMPIERMKRAIEPQLDPATLIARLVGSRAA